MSLCTWAPLEHSAQAEYVVEYARPCGHRDHYGNRVLSCERCTIWARAHPMAGRATVCHICKDVTPLKLARVWSIDE